MGFFKHATFSARPVAFFSLFSQVVSRYTQYPGFPKISGVPEILGTVTPNKTELGWISYWQMAGGGWALFSSILLHQWILRCVDITKHFYFCMFLRDTYLFLNPYFPDLKLPFFAMFILQHIASFDHIVVKYQPKVLVAYTQRNINFFFSFHLMRWCELVLVLLLELIGHRDKT